MSALTPPATRRDSDGPYAVATGCKFAVEQQVYVDLAKRLHQGTRYYADAAAFKKRLEQDVDDKGKLLQRLGLPK